MPNGILDDFLLFFFLKITKEVRVVSLAHETPTVLRLHPYQI